MASSLRKLLATTIIFFSVSSICMAASDEIFFCISPADESQKILTISNNQQGKIGSTIFDLNESNRVLVGPSKDGKIFLKLDAKKLELISASGVWKGKCHKVQGTDADAITSTTVKEPETCVDNVALCTNQQLCTKGTRKVNGKKKWDTRSKYVQFSDTAKSRGLSCGVNKTASAKLVAKDLKYFFSQINRCMNEMVRGFNKNSDVMIRIYGTEFFNKSNLKSTTNKQLHLIHLIENSDEEILAKDYNFVNQLLSGNYFCTLNTNRLKSSVWKEYNRKILEDRTELKRILTTGDLTYTDIQKMVADEALWLENLFNEEVDIDKLDEYLPNFTSQMNDFMASSQRFIMKLEKIMYNKYDYEE